MCLFFWGLIAALFARIYYVMVWVWQTQSAKPTNSPKTRAKSVAMRPQKNMHISAGFQPKGEEDASRVRSLPSLSILL